MLKLSLAITHYNRYELLLKSFAGVIDHHLIDEIVIVDDCSRDEHWKPLSRLHLFNPKIKVFRNAQNVGMLKNKSNAVNLCLNDWVILFDSDNVLTNEYLNVIPTNGLDPNTIYMPDFARPQFDYQQFAGKYIHSENLKEFHRNDTFWTMLNTCNYLVPRDNYLKVFEHSKVVKETDTLWFAYLWLKAGFGFQVVRGMQYDHLVHTGSGWLQNADYNMRMHKEIKTKIIASCL